MLRFGKISKKKLLIIALVVTLLSGFRSGEWASLGGGTGNGFPLMFWKTTTYSDAVVTIVGSDGVKREMSYNPSSKFHYDVFIVDYIFWLFVLLIVRKIILILRGAERIRTAA